MTRGQILVVEDDPGLIEGIRSILEIDGYEVMTAENGSRALTVLQSEQIPDLIISDIMMPEMDGVQFLKAVRQESRWLNIPVIFLTAKGEKADIQQGKQLGVDDYLVKPFEAEDLLVAVESRIQRQRGLNDAYARRFDALKRSILTVLNHEFRTPLTFVVAYADMLKNHDSVSLSDQELLTFLKGVSTGAVRLRHLIENFIMLIELETGDALRTFIWRRSVIDNAERLLHHAYERVQNIEPFQNPVSISVPDDLPHFIADEEYITICIAQLLSNAVKFSTPAQPIEMGAYADAEWLYLWVKDEGRGIPKAEMKAIWDTFYQIKRTVYEDKGIGNGLSIVRGIVDMHGGRVRVNSQVGQGSLFTIAIPLNPGE